LSEIQVPAAAGRVIMVDTQARWRWRGRP
jgi:hypothetical protein